MGSLYSRYKVPGTGHSDCANCVKDIHLKIGSMQAQFHWLEVSQKEGNRYINASCCKLMFYIFSSWVVYRHFVPGFGPWTVTVRTQALCAGHMTASTKCRAPDLASQGPEPGTLCRPWTISECGYNTSPVQMGHYLAIFTEYFSSNKLFCTYLFTHIFFWAHFYSH